MAKKGGPGPSTKIRVAFEKGKQDTFSVRSILSEHKAKKLRKKMNGARRSAFKRSRQEEKRKGARGLWGPFCRGTNWLRRKRNIQEKERGP